MLGNLVAAGRGSGPYRHMVVSLMDHQGQSSVFPAPVTSLGFARGRVSPSGLWHLARLLRRHRPRIVQTWLYHADLVGLMARPLTDARVIWNIRSAWHLGLRRFPVPLCARLSACPAAVVINSEAGMREHEAIGYRPKRWCLIDNGFDIERFRPSFAARESLRRELGVSRDQLLIGLIARWDAHKDHAGFFRAAAILRQQWTSIRFVLAGGGIEPSNPDVMALVQRNGLEDCVHLLGSRSDVAAVTAAIDIATCCSIAEAFPNTVGEAMASAVPCVATDVGDTKRVLDDTGIVVPPGDPAALAAAWRTVLGMGPADRARMGQAGRARVEAFFSLTQIVCRYEALYAEMAA
jgi:glycosyltransferase involved in cell wall biosynthesis